MRLLIAEDDPKLLKSLVHIFELNHYAVDGVNNGSDALNMASTGEYDGLVLDIMMPGVDGITLLKRLRADGMTTPALFLTARTEINQRIEGLDAGADDYLPKPFSTGELLARVRALGLDESYTVSSSDITAFESSLAPLNTLSTMAGWFLVVILLIGGVILVVLNIFNVRERKYEVGVLTAMGMKKWKVAAQFMCEILVVTMIAVVIGAGIGAVSSKE